MPSWTPTSPPAASDPAAADRPRPAVTHGRGEAPASTRVVRLTDDAVEDRQALVKADPQIVRWALKKMFQIECDTNAGASLLGGLIGYRKITVGDRDWRVTWRVVQDDAGDFRGEVAEVCAVGYRKDNEVSEEIKQRVADAGPSPKTKALTEALGLFPNRQAT